VIEVRASRPGDEKLAGAAEALIRAAATDADIARRPLAMLDEKLRKGQAALALRAGELVGFGYWSAWEAEAYVSHSGLVVSPDCRGRGLGWRLKKVLFESSRAALPRARLISLTTHPAIKRWNRSLGLRDVPLERLTKDPAFWEGCKGCRNYDEVRRQGKICCCDGMMLDPAEEDA